jgi:GT2 family glycosyltransferase
MINNDLLKVSIIIPCHNAQKTIVDCLDGLRSQDYPNYEIIVIDDNSNDKTLEILQNSNGIKVLRNESNYGPAYSRNRAIQEAEGEMLLLIDSDSLVEDRKLIYKHILAHRQARADIIGGGIQGIGRGPVAKADNYCHWYTNKPYSDNRMTTHLVTNNMSMKKMVFKNIGGFNEALKTGEDVDFCERAMRAGYSLGLYTDAVVKHRDRESLKEFIKNFYIVGINKIQARRMNRYRYWYLLPFDFLSSLLYWIPLGSLIGIYVIYSWFRYDKKVLLYSPFIFLAGFAHASGVASYFFKENVIKRLRYNE